MKLKKSLSALIALGAILLSACSTPKNITYFQDAQHNTISTIAETETIKLRPQDKVSIIVNSQDEQLSQLYNLPYLTRRLGTNNNGYDQGVSGYTIDSDGNIEFPIVGQINIGGLTREEAQKKITDILRNGNYVNDALVTIEFQNLTYSVLGEVNKPGKYNIDKDNITILDALSQAGDMTINGMRDKVKVQRREGDDMQHTYVVNLLSADSTYNSPVYFLRQNDVIYVEPNDNRIRQSTVNGNNLRSSSFWISLASLLTSVAVLIFK